MTLTQPLLIVFKLPCVIAATGILQCTSASVDSRMQRRRQDEDQFFPTRLSSYLEITL